MKITVRRSTMVTPSEEKPMTTLWLSNLDLVDLPVHMPGVFYYKPNGATNFFDTRVMKNALSKALVTFYPLAGRLKKDKDGRIEIDCRGQGVLFVEAESDGVLDDFGDFTPTLEVQKLIPNVDYSLGIEYYPLLVLQWLTSEEMKIVVRGSTMVTPSEERPMTRLWLSNLDLVDLPVHMPGVFYYKPNGATNFFDTRVMKNALSKVLVTFYPLAGRLKKDKDGRIEIDCQGQGVLFVEAESDGVLDDFGDFTPTLEVQKLIPNVDYSLGIEYYPLLVVQVTLFKCGGVSIGTGTHHYTADGISVMHFMKSWSEMARGLDLTMQPIIDRTVLRARAPAQPKFDHIEFQITPMKSSVEAPPLDEPVISIFKLSREQLDMLKAKSKEAGNTIRYTTLELLIAHIWICACKARGLTDDQETKLYIATDGRSRCQPTLQPGYFGNGIMETTPIALASEIQSNSIWYLASKIHNALVMRDNDYLNSTLDYLELQPDLTALADGMFSPSTCSKLIITSWVNFAVQDVDFGWGGPIFVGPGWFAFDGLIILLPKHIKDGSLSIFISLQAQHMKLFKKFLYEFFIMHSSLPSKL